TRHGRQQAGAVAGLPVSGQPTAVDQPFQGRQGRVDDPAVGPPVAAGHEADAAGVAVALSERAGLNPVRSLGGPAGLEAWGDLGSLDGLGRVTVLDTLPRPGHRHTRLLAIPLHAFMQASAFLQDGNLACAPTHASANSRRDTAESATGKDFAPSPRWQGATVYTSYGMSIQQVLGVSSCKSSCISRRGSKIG